MTSTELKKQDIPADFGKIPANYDFSTKSID